MSKVRRHPTFFLILAIVIAYLLLNFFSSFFGVSTSNLSIPSTQSTGMMEMGVDSMSYSKTASNVGRGIMPPVEDYAPSPSQPRMVVTDTYVSLLVKDVRVVLDQITDKTTALGGYMIDSNMNQPEGAASGYLNLRVPTDKRAELLDFVRQAGVRVVSENVTGSDVTDQYEDLAERMAILERTKQKFEAIQEQAVEIKDLLDVQRELTNIQTQIDNLKGRQQFLEQSAKLSRVSLQLSTDELALSYSPDQVWRPEVVLKMAVRSLIGSMRSLANSLIWIGVYSVIWLPGLIVGLIAWKVSKRKKLKQY